MVNSWVQRFIQSPQLQSWNLQNVRKNLIFVITHILYSKTWLVHFFQNNKTGNLLLEPSNCALEESECNLNAQIISVSICTPFLLGNQKVHAVFITHEQMLHLHTYNKYVFILNLMFDI